MVNRVSSAAQDIASIIRGRKTLAITGAGVSTDSGLPDYRGQGSTEEPSIEYDMFVSDPVWQRWVWQRNHETWKILDSIKPSKAHLALVALENAGLVTGIATQNVDGLHTVAGSKNVWELHGSFREVVCVDCDHEFPRGEYSELLEELNPGWPTYDTGLAVLATANRAEAEASTFQVAPCPRCAGLVKPSVVFFGESLPGTVMEGAMSAASEAQVALVLGTSLVVTTGMWVTRQAWAHDAPIVIVNRGATAGDSLATLKIDAGVSEVLEELTDILLG
ncbi:MAG: Sir2 family NAD-dependent protein deacetylase [Actinomycetaceae bacterium]|nr:Sir2 family NAD-dependent protein deacetylase [Actinomycetaceae bacterium]